MPAFLLLRFSGVPELRVTLTDGNHGTATLEHDPDPLPHCLQLGAGWMGEVYLAQDTSELDRRVALKILPVEVAADDNPLAHAYARLGKQIEARNF